MSNLFSTQPLGELLVETKGGGTPPRTNAPFWGGLIPWASVKDFRDNEITLNSTQEYITPDGLRASASNLIEPGVPIICTRMAVGRISVASVPTAINQDLKALYPKRDVDSRFLLRAVAHKQPVLEALSIGSTVRGIGLSDLLKLPIAIPDDQNEQRCIAAILDTLDDTIRHTRALIAKLHAARAGLLHDLLTRGLNEQGQLRPTSEIAPELYQTYGKAVVPREWEVVSLMEKAEIASGVTLGRNVSGPDVLDLPYLRVANVEDGRLDLTEIKTVKIFRHELHRFALQRDDILLTEGGDIDKLGRGTIWSGQIEPCLHQNHVFRVRPDVNELHPPFFALLIESAYGKDYFLRVAKQTTNLASINSTQLKAFPLLRPKIGEQQHIVQILRASRRNKYPEHARLRAY